MLGNTILKPYDGLNIPFTQAGYLNATAVAAHFGKRPIDYLRLPDTDAYIGQLCDFLTIEKSELIKAQRGSISNGGGTWLHRKLAVPFARWCDVRFSVWCDHQIELILSGTYESAAMLATQPRLHFALKGCLRSFDNTRDAWARQCLIYQIKALHMALGLPIPPMHLVGKDCAQTQLEV